MKYFSNEQINSMKERIKTDFSSKSGIVYMMYVDRIEQLNNLYDERKASRQELLQAMLDLERFLE